MPNKPSNLSVEQWVDMFRAIKLSETQMHQWHAEFEARHPDSHQSFLEWLNLPAEKIKEVRRSSAGEWSRTP